MGKKGKSRNRPVKLKTESAAMAAAGEKLRFDKAVFGLEAPMSKGKKLVREKQYEKTSYGRKTPAAKKAKACGCRSAVNGYDQPLPEELIKKIAKWCFEKYSG